MMTSSETELSSNRMMGSDRSSVRWLFRCTSWFTVFILFFVNLINYMDRYTIAGILPDIKVYFNIGNDKGGLLQTGFVLSYMAFAPLFGYLGDRCSRRIIMSLGVLLWSLTTFAGSFVTSYGWFLFFRALVGIGEASYSTIAPTIISDLFVRGTRSRMLALFYFAIPVGSGLGYIVGSETARIMNGWQWALRITPVIGVVAVLLIYFCMEDPIRGQSEGVFEHERSSWSEDIASLMKNKSFIFSTIGFTCVAFVAGALAWWGPNFILLGLKLQPGYSNAQLSSVSYTFGIITMISGLIGVPLGSYLSQTLKEQYPYIDPVICGAGLLLSAPLLFIASILADKSIVLCYVFVFLGELSLNLNWSIVADILLYVVTPLRRSTAEAFQILISHAFGDAGSPYFIGLLSEAIKNMLQANMVTDSSASNIGCDVDSNENAEVCFKSLQYALFTTSFVEVLGAMLFFLCALYILQDKKEAERQSQDNNQVI